MNHEFCYLETIYEHLISDAGISQIIDPSSFYFETTDTLDDEALRKKCPNGKAVWIIPGELNVKFQQQRTNCTLLEHDFDVVLFLECSGRQFEFSRNNDGELELQGMYTELSRCRSLFRKSIDEFNCSIKNEQGLCHGQFYFQGASRIEKINGYLVGGLRYRTEIYKY